jgi:FlaA1/EpsC-like NDP-sugar epimerase
MDAVMIPSRGARLLRQPLYRLVERAIGAGTPDHVKAALDVLLMAGAALWAWSLGYGQLEHAGTPWPFIGAVLVVRLPLHYLLRLHRTSWRSVSRYDVMRLAASAALGLPLIALLCWLLPGRPIVGHLPHPHLPLIGEASSYLLLLSGARITARALYGSVLGRHGRRALIVGTGHLGRSLASQLFDSPREYSLVGFLDDGAQARGRRVRGLPVLGEIADLPQVVRRMMIEQVIIALPSPSPDEVRRILGACEQCAVPARIVPPLEELVSTAPAPRPREVRMEDLLPRPQVELDREAICRFLSGKRVLVTGGGGSIGSELCRQAVQNGAAQLLVLGRGENSVFEAVQELEEIESRCYLVPVICDVRDREALAEVFASYAPDVVFHAAAHKHVPLMERYPQEAVKNNVVGTLNVVELAVAHGAERLVNISTDKAVNPSSVMGLTKRVGEMIVQAYSAAYGADMVSVRFGNVLGSRGSVVRVMQRQIERRRPVTVTDPSMVRYFMTIPEAVQLVLQAGALGGRGEVFVLEMGHPVRILDLARDLIRLSGLVPERDIPIEIIGRRPGEKVREELLTQGEARSASGNGRFHVAPCYPVALPDVQDLVGRLSSAAANGGASSLLPLIRAAVPEFAPEGPGYRGARAAEAAVKH